MIIAFHPASSGGLSFRGSEIALYDYAHFNEKLLKNKSIICLKKSSYNEHVVLNKFIARFDTIIYYESTSDLEDQLIFLKVDAFYTIRHGRIEEPMLSKIPMLVHCVYDMSEQYGIMAGVSESVAKRFNCVSFVPHMCHVYNTDENYRAMLKIPDNAIVYMRHGGADTWDLLFVKNVVIRILNDRDDIYFLFAVRPNILKDINHTRLICLEPFADLEIKRKFINTGDALLHAQSLGETFGLSIAESSYANKPVITWNGGDCQEHLRILGNNCIKYNNEEELYHILTTFNKDIISRSNWKSYDNYTPEKVITIFDNVFLDPIRSLKNLKA
jgi:hypothetical protein